MPINFSFKFCLTRSKYLYSIVPRVSHDNKSLVVHRNTPMDENEKKRPIKLIFQQRQSHNSCFVIYLMEVSTLSRPMLQKPNRAFPCILC